MNPERPPEAGAASPKRPFDGITVIEVGQFVAVPYAAQMLADGGAHVIKVEPREGEATRHLSPLAPGETRHYLMRNRGKHALPLDLKHPDAAAILGALLARADVVLTNMRPGLAADLGLDYDHLAPRFPRLVVGNVTAFGERGPDAALPGMDLVVQARSGLMVTNGRMKDGLPTTGESPIADYMAAALLGFGVASALYQRERTGRGSRVDVSLLMAALVLQNNLMIRVEAVDGAAHAAFRDWLAGARRDGVAYADQAEHMPRTRPTALVAVYYRTFVTRDSAIAVACASPGLRRRFMKAVGLTDPALDAGVTDASALEAHYGRLRADVEAMMASRATDEWRAVLTAHGVPAAAVALPIEMLDAEQTVANGMLHRLDHPALGPVTVLGSPLGVGEDGFTPGPATAPFGSETAEILAWAGFAARDVERLLAGGAVGLIPPPVSGGLDTYGNIVSDREGP